MKRFTSFLLLVALLIYPAVLVQASPDNESANIKKGESSDNVILLQLRLRDLGYYNYKITGFFGDFTGTAVKDFQKENNISEDGIAGQKTLNALFNNSAKRKPIKPIVKPATQTKPKNFKYGKLRDWFSYVNNRFCYRTKYKVVDFDTGKSYYVIRVGGQNHADVAPATKNDANTMFITLGRTWDNWQRRALIVYINGEPIAASLYGEPHGSTGVPGNGINLKVGNDPDGHMRQVCIHFLNSMTHETHHVDPGHQYQIRRAAGLVN
jgi:peptidoglycan hydrolase-like protein with peptidoglycan-binding domain